MHEVRVIHAKLELGVDLDIRTVVFLRRNIFEYIISSIAREEDKLSADVTELTWDDRDTLLRVIDERFRVAGEPYGWSGDPWQTFFCPEVDGVPTRDWIFRNVLPRPRDLIKYLNTCIEVAVNRDHKRIEADDLKEALKSHSSFALKQVLAEYKAEEPWLQQALYSFMGTRSEWSFKALTDHLTALHLDRGLPQDVRDAIATLVAVRFMGVKLASGEVRHASTYEDGIVLREKVRVTPVESPLGFVIHPVFHAHLGICGDEDPTGALTEPVGVTDESAPPVEDGGSPVPVDRKASGSSWFEMIEKFFSTLLGRDK
ncbi:P-loop ATPase, Sll1717 family [Symbiobacterium terraclitae]|uniref:P-loop ATPase, Sll1717 family n=1 Tax=Symbiobacterium terraclitae TaxID=557451 RepID=UPI0035B4FDCF